MTKDDADAAIIQAAERIAAAGQSPPRAAPGPVNLPMIRHGTQAMGVVTSTERARDLRQRPAVIRAAAQGSSPGQFTMTSYYRDELGLPEMGVVARQLWRQAGIGSGDVRTAVLYDHFTPYVLLQLEELGFCPRGQARHFIADGTSVNQVAGDGPVLVTAGTGVPTSGLVLSQG